MAKQKKRNRNNQISFNEVVASQSRLRDIHLVPKSITQEKYIKSLLDHDKCIVVAHGPAGTGKTYLAMRAAIRNLIAGNIERIVITRPAVEVEDEKHGFLPGSLEEKMAPWTRPLLDVAREHYSPVEITRMLENQVIEISPLAYMRGRTLKNAWIICDEMQGTTPNQMKMLLTRIGDDSKIVITGDQEQTERRFRDVNGLRDFVERLEYSPHGNIECIQFTQGDIRRHPIISDIITMYG